MTTTWSWQKQCLDWLNRPGFRPLPPQLFAFEICRMHLWLELRGQRDWGVGGGLQYLEPRWLLPAHCCPRTSWPLLPQPSEIQTAEARGS